MGVIIVQAYFAYTTTANIVLEEETGSPYNTFMNLDGIDESSCLMEPRWHTNYTWSCLTRIL